jgi:chromosome segregation ATPase
MIRSSSFSVSPITGGPFCEPGSSLELYQQVEQLEHARVQNQAKITDAQQDLQEVIAKGNPKEPQIAELRQTLAELTSRDQVLAHRVEDVRAQIASCPMPPPPF